MQEKRKLKRRHLIYYLRVFEKNADQPIGHMVDISDEGMMLISEDPAESRWCREDENPDFYNTGFQLIHPSPEHIKITGHLVQKFCFKESLGRL